MAGVRSDGQKQVIVMMREVFLEKIDAAVPRMGFNDRASLIREAVYKMLKEARIEVQPEDKTAPGRAGKGGRPKSSITAVEKAALEKRRRKIQSQISAHEVELAAIIEGASTPEAQDEIMAITDKTRRLKTMENLAILKGDAGKKRRA